MPKKFSDSDKKKWLELYENGETEKWIAKMHAKCDVRTVRIGIQEARHKQDAKLARVELLKDALRKHQDNLFEAIDGILFTLTVPQVDSAPLSWNEGKDSIFTKLGATSFEIQMSDANKPPGRSARQVTTADLLKQHLKNDRLWKILAQQLKMSKAHLNAKIALQRKTVVILEETTGYKVVDQNSVKPYICSYTAGALFYGTVLKQAFGTNNNIHIEKEMVANKASGDVRYRNMILAEAPGEEEKLKEKLLDAFQKLESSPEITPVMETFKTLCEITDRAKQVVEQIKLLGLIPGQCEICRRLGI